MKVRELVKLLQGEPNQDREVIMSRDAEGNGYSPLRGTWTGAYRAESTYYGEVGLEGIDEEDRARGYTEEDAITDGVPALILSPIN